MTVLHLYFSIPSTAILANEVRWKYPIVLNGECVGLRRRAYTAEFLGVDEVHARAQYNLGSMYSNGDGVPRDHAEAVKWYRKAAEQGHQEAQSKLDLLEKRQVGIPGETLGDRLLQHDTLQHISFKAGFQSKQAGQATKNFTIKVIDTKVLVPPTHPAEGWVEKWTVRINGEQADYRVEYKSDGRGGYFIKSSVLK